MDSTICLNKEKNMFYCLLTDGSVDKDFENRLLIQTGGTILRFN